jgi:hypothetical protein
MRITEPLSPCYQQNVVPSAVLLCKFHHAAIIKLVIAVPSLSGSIVKPSQPVAAIRTFALRSFFEFQQGRAISFADAANS